MRQATRGLVGVVALVLCAGGFAAPVAHAADQPQVSVTLTSVAASGAKPTDKVTLKAKVTNTGTVDAFGVQALLWRSRDPITDLNTLHASPAGTTGWGSMLSTAAPNYSLITNSTTAFAPGESRTITVGGTLADLGFETAGAAYAVGIRVLGTPDASSNYQAIGDVRTFVAVPGAAAMPVTPVVLLEAQPTKLTDNLFANDSLATDLQGRLNDLLTGIEADGLSYIVDPALLDEVTDAADGYNVRTDQGDVPGTGQQAATAWLARFRRLPSLNGARTLFANPDLSADTAAVVKRAAAAEKQDLAAGLPLVVLPPDGQATPALVKAATTAAPVAIVATNPTLTDLVNSAAGPPVIAATALPITAPPWEYLAEAAVGDGQVRLIQDAAGLDENRAATTTWTRYVPLSEVLRQPPTAKAAFGKAKTPTLTAGQHTDVQRAASDIALYNDAVPSAPLAGAENAAPSRLASTTWIGDTASRTAYRTALVSLADARAVTNGVTVNVSPRIVMSSRRNEFPVTVTNQTGVPVRVQIVIDTTEKDRINVPPSDVVEVQPGVSQTVAMRCEASVNGLVIATVHAATPGGHRLTPNNQVSIEVTDLGFIAWIIVIASGVLLVGLTALRVRQVANGAVRHPIKDSPSMPPKPKAAK